MKKIIMIIMGLLLSICILLIFIFRSNHEPLNIQLKKLNLDNVDKLMIVAHPDDETIWGGVHLLEDNYLVVCVTCGTNKTRVTEIKKVMDYSSDELIILGYPDKIWGKRSEWKIERKSIESDLEKIINYKDWNLIVTHNPKGEYGHIHHKLTSMMVTDIYDKKENLYYFGRYYKEKHIKNLNIKSNLNEKNLKRKIDEMLPIYKSQGFIDNKFGHMYPYEEWVRYLDYK